MSFLENIPTVSVIAQTAEPPVAVADLKAQLRVDTDAEDTLMETYLRVAAEYLERITGIAILRRTYTQAFRNFCGDGSSIGPMQGTEVVLLRSPAISVESIQYRAANGSEQTVGFENYFLTTSKPPRLCLRPGCAWPATDNTPDSIRVNFTAGYSTADLPPELKQCILFVAGHFFENRTPFLQISGMCEVPLTLKAIIDSLRVFYW